jgi:quercetin 2,3-dioxygenase
MYNRIISNIKLLGFTWETRDPFLFCVHHLDYYPKGNGELGPDAPLSGRNLGQDFSPKDGWRMYHGETIPGFPAHPHRGFETITVVLKGFVDHSDSHGAAGRYGEGDVQWMTAGAGLQHAEMFPLLNQDDDNTLELFQIWLNLPKARKFAKPFYKMLWSEEIPVVKEKDSAGNLTEITLIAGEYGEICPPAPAPDSWAADPQNETAIWLIKMSGNAQWTIPAASAEVNRTLYFYRGNELSAAGVEIKPYHSVDLLAEEPVILQNGEGEAFLLLLQSKPILEPVVQHGPFVMNVPGEIHQAIVDYRRTQFGGWPWPRHDNVHSHEKKRFAEYADGREEIPSKK